MNKKEILKLLKYLDSYYSRKFSLPDDKQDFNLKVNTWHDFLSDYSSGEVMPATKKLISEKEWPPTPGEIMKQIEKLKMSEEDKISGQEAWGKLINLIRKHGVMYGGSKKILENITEASKEAIRALGGLRIIGMSDENETFLMNNFIKAYDSFRDRKQEKEMLPNSIKNDVESIRERETDIKKLI